jgi:hypothetical protein
MMVKVLLYGYATGTYASRRIAAKLEDSVAFRYLAAGNQPDFRTISDFRKRHGEALSKLFVEVLKLCRKAGLVKLGRVAVDGTKIQANAWKHKAMSYGRMKSTEATLQREADELLRRAEQADEEDDRRYGKDRRGDELPEELAHRESRLKKIREAMAALQAEAKEKALAEGKGTRGAEPEDKAQRNFTDPESTIQKRGRTYPQGYNAQVAVDGEAQVIVSHAGSADRVDGQEVMHSAFLASNGGTSAVHRRVWTGQVGVLLPFVEERRQDLLGLLAGVLQVPYRTRFGVVEDPRDLEIGHIESQLHAVTFSGRNDLLDLARKLREIRNCLSHQEPVAAQQLLAPALGAWTRTALRR